MSMNFSAFEERSKETNGYRKRTIQSIHFQKEDNARHKDFGPPLDAENAQQLQESLSTEMYFGHEENHPIAMHDFEITDAIDTNSGERQTGRKAQLSNIAAAKTVADIIRSCLGPKAMLKMLLDPMGGIVLTNDGHAILREIEVSHPAAKSMIELSRTQDEEVGDGTTTVIIMAGEILAQSLPQLERNIHPVQIIAAFRRALKDALEIIDDISLPIDVNDDKAMRGLISSSIGTKFVSRWSDLMCDLALKAVRTVTWEAGNGKTEVDIKRYARVEKVPGGEIEDSRVLDGVMLNKDITHPKMRRRIENPRIVLLDCPLEYKKGESQTNIEISKEEDWNRILQIEEEQVKAMCEAVLALKPDLVITEKGVSDLAQHYFVKANVTALRRVRKTDNNRIARATGATIVNRVDDLQDSDVGTLCGLFEIEKIGDEYFTFLTKCQNPKACTVLLRGPSKDVLNEIERNLQDAMGVARNVMFNPRLAPGGGATEMAVSVRLSQLAKGVEGVQQWPYKAVADALEVIPRTLVQNAGASPVRVLTDLRAKHAEGKHSWGINGDSGVIADMKEYGVWEPEAIKLQSIKTAVEAACLLLRVDDICSARKAAQVGNGLHGGGDE
ncbi:T-complex protein 1 subunit gamma [Colletotrichum sp. SAR 10_70]|nr:T-complex protein 1 subunit gamma [Colletotrichum sp. SAR 10_71]KAI8153137.1 T-complex protein 1 subunit gamma [Colletotrichum sp. SAR 10_70]KAI8154580.1 T-complex protein 1 subunit gamma [Colletotrichum sp. SAR 10_65]KAI8173017.1 T-complex protein 1 subunit gamma [Colletotrichum sp. SAR 10_75]KAI8197127.1 T-complex protein 1 subunit gamma [Colletotrichum sp. SAR 10_76]KAI8215588.1 T-complex protein 1 subunit gamma [Colletotrichum sp. SAR 10_77]KAI8217914.1 T-complex protein 1 subunit gamm